MTPVDLEIRNDGRKAGRNGLLRHYGFVGK